ncbi:hypothetical protein HMPREF1983_00902 [Gemella bergeri ATCC 700627]|uniref:Uncharacterized protein n=1 Tax=Gemella bergeri ATCC 700627 TaxID=1321820 RepID=U2RWY7_9BACL|nr:hypothetical protein [Gemella bergeri]ERK58068.1 hypothetical protein HMPREF1983_00902 [Gemella bergeri ATCC 700627]
MLRKIHFKKFYIFIAILEIILIAALIGWNYFKDRKMGMVRHIMHKNIYKFPKVLTENNIKLMLGVLILFVIIQVILVIVYKKFIFSLVINIILVIGSAYYILTNNVDSEFIYYYIVIFCGGLNTLRFLQFLTLDFKKEI